MQKDQIVSSWEMKLQHPAASPQTWTFSSDGLILQNEMQFGQWQHLGDGFFRIHLEKMRLCGLPVEYTARLEADFLTLYHGGEEMFAGQRLVALRQADPPEPSEETAVHHGIFGGISVSSVFGPEDEPTKQEAPPLPDIHQPWIGVWAPTRDIYLQRNYSRGGRSSELRLPNSSDSFMVLTADGVYQVGRTGRRGTWRRVPDGRMLLDQGEPRLERYYVIRQTPEGSERIGPYKEDGSRFKEGLEYTFYETIRQQEPQPAVASRPAGTVTESQAQSSATSVEPAATKPSVSRPTEASTNQNSTNVSSASQEDWRDVKAREWRERGRWRGNIGGCWVTSCKDPEDWEHPHNK